MKRMFDSRRLGNLLEDSSFRPSFDLGDSMIWYARPAHEPGLWERIRIDCGGKHGEWVSASAVLSTCYAFNCRGLLESHFVRLPSLESRPSPDQVATGGSQHLASDSDALEWERLVARIAPDKAREVSRKIGPELLSRTVDARGAVDKYFATFQNDDWRELRSTFEARAVSSEVREAERLAKEPGVVQIYNAREFYKTIILGIILHSDRVEGKQVVQPGVELWPEVNPNSKELPDWSKWGLIWRIEMLADRVIGRYPEPVPSTLSD